MNLKIKDEIKERLINKEFIISNLVKEDINKYINDNRRKTFSDEINEYIIKKNIKPSDLYSKANIDRRVFSKLTKVGHKPSKNTALCLCIAMNLSVNETSNMLKKLGYALSMVDDFDIVIEYFIEKEIFNILFINIYLLEFNLPILGSTTR